MQSDDNVPEIAPVIGPGVRDVQTVTPAGQSTRAAIDGVVTHTPVAHVDHRGAVFEIHNHDPAMGPEPVVWVYSDLVRPGQVKGWARHDVKVDRYTLIVGDLLVLMYDARAESPTHGLTQSVVLSPSRLPADPHPRRGLAPACQHRQRRSPLREPADRAVPP